MGVVVQQQSQGRAEITGLVTLAPFRRYALGSQGLQCKPPGERVGSCYQGYVPPFQLPQCSHTGGFPGYPDRNRILAIGVDGPELEPVCQAILPVHQVTVTVTGLIEHQFCRAVLCVEITLQPVTGDGDRPGFSVYFKPHRSGKLAGADGTGAKHEQPTAGGNPHLTSPAGAPGW